MLQIYIQGMKNGQKEVEISCPVDSLELENNEYFGEVSLRGTLKKIEQRYSFVGQAKCMAKFLCDRSLKDFEEEIVIDIKFSAKQKGINEELDDFVSDSEDEVLQISDDDKQIDVSALVAEELLVNLPMKRISPEFRDKEFEDLFPEYSDESEQNHHTEDRWSVLKNIKLN